MFDTCPICQASLFALSESIIQCSSGSNHFTLYPSTSYDTDVVFAFIFPSTNDSKSTRYDYIISYFPLKTVFDCFESNLQLNIPISFDSITEAKEFAESIHNDTNPNLLFL